MKFSFLLFFFSLFFLLISFFLNSTHNSDLTNSHLSSLNQFHVNELSRSLVPIASYPPRDLILEPGQKALPSNKPTTALIATLDGTMYMVDREESGSMKVIWSFPTGSPIYNSYKAPINNDNGKENASATLINGFVECGKDWALYMHDKHFGKMRISETIAEYVARTPTFSEDGAVTLGSKRSTLFEIDAKTGRIIQMHAMSELDNSSIPLSDDKQIVPNTIHRQNKEFSDPVKLKSPEMLLKIFRTDYSLKSVGPGSGIVLWTMTVAEFEAVLLCQHASFDAENEYVSDMGLNFAMPCQEMQQVFRLQKNFLLEPSITERLPRDYHENDMLPMPASDLMLPSQPSIDRFFNGHDSNAMLPVPLPISLPSRQPKFSNYDNNNNNADVLSHPPVEFTTSEKVYLNNMNKWSLPLLSVFFAVVSLVIYYAPVVKNQDILKGQNNEFELKNSPSKRKKTRKSGKNNGTVGKKEKHMSSESEDALTQKNNDKEAWLFNQADGRMVGKLFVSNKEIAKGSNGTIVFEGMYEEGRAVAVKRLVRAHHDVASKEIQNLILSDRHPNIVRWHGVEYDQDFVYLALERCSYSLDNLIFKCSLKTEMDTDKDNMQDLWKPNGYPSPLLLKLMRDVISGIVHLHELGIIHRDLKPQNVLIIEGRSLCAKLSDMGISKRLLENMSSLANNVTGGGSSGWQAPEQLVQGRQTRAVDLFSLGCVLFFCLTGGRHPFGEQLERDVNVVRNNKDLFLVEFIPEAEDLISCLLNPDPDLRPKAIEVLHHPFFWSAEMRLSFLRDTSDRVELEDRETDSDVLNALESIATVALGVRWNEKVESAFLSNIGRYRRYKFDSVRDLLRVMRNKLNHYREMPQEIQELVGPIPEGFNDYFASRFPKLLIEVYKVICKYCKEEECFQRYFRNVD
ncbi:hypothetical protein Lal_00012248 [Lupinus albus]|uniref:non-specific serine/threonine protein kinase n=1 Tax=Lupinus albus TaxID=3870 RepID=A0A6A5MFU2_LUPAL|nr:putative protein kinase IRE1 family [Lupinus albus]KAF1872027.1 hypothetical protein Lal_00012248 [Lupinus albus]